MVLLRAANCVPQSCFKISVRCTCGAFKCAVSNEHGNDEEQETLTGPPSQVEMEGLALTSTKARDVLAGDSFRQRIKAQGEGDEQSTDVGSGSSSSSGSEVEVVPRRETISFDNEEGWHTPAGGKTPAGGSADFRDINGFGAQNVAAAVAAALSPLPPRQDWWEDANTRIVAGLEAATSLTRLLSVELVSHPQVNKSRPTPWREGESHGRYQKLGARQPSESYIAWWLNTGDNSLLSLHEVVDRQALDRCLAADPLGKRLKLLIKAVKCTLPFPGKGPKDADTVASFFGNGASLTRSLTAEGAEVVVIQIDLFSVWILRWALQNVGFRQGNVVDIILVDWPGQAVVASKRVSVTDSFLKLKG